MKKDERRCLCCRRVGNKATFWRVVRVYPSGKVQLNLGQGRSAYICCEETCIKMAGQKNRLGRALKASVSQEIYELLILGQKELESQTRQTGEIVPKGDY